MSSFAQRAVTLSRIGYAPAPGTMATLVTLPFVILISWFSFDYLIILAATIGIGFALVRASLPFFDKKDPHEIVIDEVVGCLVTFYGIALTSSTLFAGFILFRILDVCKPSFIGRTERLPGVWGIMLDDIVAGIVANIILRAMF
ncbi:phosphatidylglycerophosphatase A [Candidatus Dependentiae bacterium]|nr:phosphatidylglycerophosphatase A [Candidatus Dependentiae bacterium]